MAARNRGLVEPDVSHDEIMRRVRAARPSVALYVLAMGLAIVAPHVAAFVYLVIAFVGVALAQSERL